MKKLALALSLSLLCLPALAARQTHEAAVSAMFADSGALGMVVVTVQGGLIEVYGRGETRPGSGQLPGDQSLVRIGSGAQVFTAEVLARLVEEGKLGLDDTLQRHAGAGRVVPRHAGAREITVRDLATHVSGLPRGVSVGPPKYAAPFAWPGPDVRWGELKGGKTEAAPGTEADYSNIGYDLLGDALASAGGAPYTSLLARLVTTPLQMSDTTATPTPAQCARLMSGADLDNSGPCGATIATAASSGLFSTPLDMGVWLRKLVSVVPAAASTCMVLKPWVTRAAMPAMKGFDIPGPADALGIGWVRLADGRQHSAPIWHKTGSGAGFMSYTALLPRQRSAVFVVVSKVDLKMLARMTRAGNVLLRQLGDEVLAQVGSGFDQLPCPLPPATS
ncbi:D-alanyl-D-alanine-carboxypeptidase/endopeptidase AmpH [Janthinobacterium psychrotolerans]|uniref:D-alanyl-D-alanine-carboxypeptidase / D-alanyl-D-alanine-endopeptidase n=1 Tax=Janthinobacterium psychrotolerans TaxID=1747903 RepID=A0A1A7CB81_9BURK|nr:D-alanyl-D-alanine-carboxypeptidase/endopeptidase AmpH [Janthinobacterium psychrotolerans]OBV41563.1 D-alanyl-D-alanine-carboxypeptidase / D-alanyl-D-alanine-endopeptidase [Janthinobacterium psychrotolerans]